MSELTTDELEFLRIQRTCVGEPDTEALMAIVGNLQSAIAQAREELAKERREVAKHFDMLVEIREESLPLVNGKAARTMTQAKIEAFRECAEFARGRK